MENYKTFFRLYQIQMIILFLTTAPSLVATQSTSSNANYQSNDSNNDDSNSGTIALLVLVVMCGVLFLGSFSLWIHCCCEDSPRRYAYSSRHPIIAILDARSQRGHSFNAEESGGGIDKAEIDAFPTISYATARKIGLVDSGGSVECAVCLSEFQGEELLLLLPMCDHAFHPHCVGVWLANHRTCPTCRADLALINSRIKTRKPMNSDSSDSNRAVYSSDDFEQVVMQLECGLRTDRIESGSGIRMGEDAETGSSWSLKRLSSGDLKSVHLVNPIGPIPKGSSQGLPLSIPDREGEKTKINMNNVKLKRSVSLEALPRLSSLNRPQTSSDGEEAGVGSYCCPAGWSDRRASSSSAARVRLEWFEEGEGQGGTSKRLTRPPI